MISKELYKKDKAIICELSGRNRIIGNVYFPISLVLCAVGTAAAIFRGEGSDSISGMTMFYSATLWIPYFGFFLRSNGLTVYTGIKNASLARETFKGSTLFLDTLCGIPARRESVFRYVMESWYMMTFAYLIPLASALITAVTVNAGMSLNAVIFAAMYFLWTFVMFFQTFAVTIKSKKIKKLLNILLSAEIITFSIYIIASVFIGIFKNEGLGFPFIESITNSVRLSPAAAVIILAAAVIYPAVMELVFRKKILKKKEVGWYE